MQQRTALRASSWLAKVAALQTKSGAARSIHLTSSTSEERTGNSASSPPSRETDTSASRAPPSSGEPSLRYGQGAAAGNTAARAQYAKAGYDFVEHFRVAGPRAALGGIQSNLMLYGLVGAGLVLYGVYYLTTYPFLLTTDPAPQRNTMFQRYPSDYAVVENKWTGRRRALQVEPAPESARHPDGTLPYRERTIHVNRLKDRLMVYQQPTQATIVMELDGVLRPDMFIHEKARGERGGVALRRTDQLLPDTTGDGTRVAVQQCAATVPQPRLVVETEMRMRDTKNGGAQGNILAFRETVKHVIRDVLESRCRDVLLARATASGTKRAYAEEMIKNGTLTPDGIGLSTLVQDVPDFEEEVFKEVRKRMGDDVLLYHHKISVL